MSTLMVGNIVATIAAMFMLYAGVLKEKKKILFIQTIQIALLVASNFILGGIIGGILNILCIIRNLLSYNDKLGLKSKIIITVLSIGLSIPFNNKGLLGLLPTISTVLYLWLMNTKDVIKFKWLIIFTNFTWLVYDIIILSIVTAVFDFLCIIANFVTILVMKKDNKKVNTNIENKEETKEKVGE